MKKFIVILRLIGIILFILLSLEKIFHLTPLSDKIVSFACLFTFVIVVIAQLISFNVPKYFKEH